MYIRILIARTQKQMLLQAEIKLLLSAFAVKRDTS